MKNDLEKMSSSKPYLLRAFYDWIVDNDKTPYIVLNTDYPGVRVPRQFIENGRIILNISEDAVDALVLDNVKVQFRASFGGVTQGVIAPIGAVLAVYACQNGKGMIFAEDEEEHEDSLGAPILDIPTKPEVLETKPGAKKDSSTKPDDDEPPKGKGSSKWPDYLHIIK